MRAEGRARGVLVCLQATLFAPNDTTRKGFVAPIHPLRSHTHTHAHTQTHTHTHTHTHTSVRREAVQVKGRHPGLCFGVFAVTAATSFLQSLPGLNVSVVLPIVLRYHCG